MTKKTNSTKTVARAIGEADMPLIGLAIDWWRSSLGLQRYNFYVSAKPSAVPVESEIDEDSKIVTVYFGKIMDPLTPQLVATLVREELLRVLYRTSDEAGFINTLMDHLEVDSSIEAIEEILAPVQEDEERLYGEDLPRLDEDEENENGQSAKKPTVH